MRTTPSISCLIPAGGADARGGRDRGGHGQAGRAAALTALEEAVHGADLEHALHVLVQDAHLRLPVGVDDELCDVPTGLSQNGRGPPVEGASAPQGGWGWAHLSSWARPAQTV